MAGDQGKLNILKKWKTEIEGTLVQFKDELSFLKEEQAAMLEEYQTKIAIMESIGIAFFQEELDALNEKKRSINHIINEKEEKIQSMESSFKYKETLKEIDAQIKLLEESETA